MFVLPVLDFAPNMSTVWRASKLTKLRRLLGKTVSAATILLRFMSLSFRVYRANGSWMARPTTRKGLRICEVPSRSVQHCSVREEGFPAVSCWWDCRQRSHIAGKWPERSNSQGSTRQAVWSPGSVELLLFRYRPTFSEAEARSSARARPRSHINPHPDSPGPGMVVLLSCTNTTSQIQLFGHYSSPSLVARRTAKRRRTERAIEAQYIRDARMVARPRRVSYKVF